MHSLWNPCAQTQEFSTVRQHQSISTNSRTGVTRTGVLAPTTNASESRSLMIGYARCANSASHTARALPQSATTTSRYPATARTPPAPHPRATHPSAPRPHASPTSPDQPVRTSPHAQAITTTPLRHPKNPPAPPPATALPTPIQAYPTNKSPALVLMKREQRRTPERFA